MKKQALLISSLLITILLVSAFSVIQVTSDNDQGVIGIHYLTLNPGIDKEEAENYLKTEWLTLFLETPGINASVGVADRGKSPGDYVMIYTFDSKWTRDHYFPSEGQYGEEIKKVVEKHSLIYDKLFKYFDKDKYSHINYVLLAEAK